MTDKRPTEQELAAMLADARKARAEACWNEIQATLEKHGCQLAAVIEVAPDGRTAIAHPRIQVV